MIRFWVSEESKSINCPGGAGYAEQGACWYGLRWRRPPPEGKAHGWKKLSEFLGRAKRRHNSGGGVKQATVTGSSRLPSLRSADAVQTATPVMRQRRWASTSDLLSEGLCGSKPFHIFNDNSGGIAGCAIINSSIIHSQEPSVWSHAEVEWFAVFAPLHFIG